MKTTEIKIKLMATKNYYLWVWSAYNTCDENGTPNGFFKKYSDKSARDNADISKDTQKVSTKDDDTLGKYLRNQLKKDYNCIY